MGAAFRRAPRVDSRRRLWQTARVRRGTAAPDMRKQFEDLKASELYCPRCKVSQPVRERLLLVLPHSELHDYRCTTCGTSVGSREVRQAPGGVTAGVLPLRPLRRRTP